MSHKNRRSNGYKKNNRDRNQYDSKPISKNFSKPKMADHKKTKIKPTRSIPKDVILKITDNNTVFWKMSEDGISNKHH